MYLFVFFGDRVYVIDIKFESKGSPVTGWGCGGKSGVELCLGISLLSQELISCTTMGREIRALTKYHKESLIVS